MNHLILGSEASLRQACHDLRTSLSVVLGYSQTITARPDAHTPRSLVLAKEAERLVLETEIFFETLLLDQSRVRLQPEMTSLFDLTEAAAARVNAVVSCSIQVRQASQAMVSLDTRMVTMALIASMFLIAGSYPHASIELVVDEQQVRIEGPGLVSQRCLPHFFLPFITTVCQLHHGSLLVEQSKTTLTFSDNTTLLDQI